MHLTANFARRSLLFMAAFYAVFMAFALSTPALAQSAAPASSGPLKPAGVSIDFPSFASMPDGEPRLATFILGLYRYALGIAGTIAVLMIIYGGVKYIAQPESTAARSEALDTIKSSVWGIALLAGAFLILNTINTDLVSLSDPELRVVAIPTDDQFDYSQQEDNLTGGSVGGTATPCRVDGGEAVTLDKVASYAKDYLATGPTLQGSSKCGSSASPAANVQDAAASRLPVVCAGAKSSGCSASCVAGGPSKQITLCPNLLENMTFLQKAEQQKLIPPFTVTALTGGEHADSSPHYEGRKADIDLQNHGSDKTWQDVVNFINQNKYGDAYCEFNKDGKTIRLHDCTGITASNATNQHIDIMFGGAGSLSRKEAEQYANRAQKLARDFLALGPSLKIEGSYGIPPKTAADACVASDKIDPRSILNSVAAGSATVVSCNKSQVSLTAENPVSKCGCAQGGAGGNVVLKEKLLQFLYDLQKDYVDGQSSGLKKVPSFMVVGLTGGIQKYDSDSSHHYSGEAADIIPIRNGLPSNDLNDWKALYRYVQSKKYYARYEYLRVFDDVLNYFSTDKEDLFTYPDPFEKGVVTVYPSSCLKLNMTHSGTLSTLENIPKDEDKCYDARIHVNAY